MISRWVKLPAIAVGVLFTLGTTYAVASTTSSALPAVSLHQTIAAAEPFLPFPPGLKTAAAEPFLPFPPGLKTAAAEPFLPFPPGLKTAAAAEPFLPFPPGLKTAAAGPILPFPGTAV